MYVQYVGFYVYSMWVYALCACTVCGYVHVCVHVYYVGVFMFLYVQIVVMCVYTLKIYGYIHLCVQVYCVGVFMFLYVQIVFICVCVYLRYVGIFICVCMYTMWVVHVCVCTVCGLCMGTNVFLQVRVITSFGSGLNMVVRHWLFVLGTEL